MLRALIDHLPEAQREVIALAFFGELSHSEIAQRLGIPPGTVKGRVRLGLEKLRERLRPGSQVRSGRAAHGDRVPGPRA